MTKRKTLIDVATAAGVSKMTASRALRGDRDVSAASKERVIKAAKEIGYFGNNLAASLSSERSDIIGVVVPSLTNIVFPQAMSGVSDALVGTGLQPAFGVTDYDLDREYEVVGRMLSWRPAGMIVTGVDQSAPTRQLLSEAGIPIVQIMDSDGDAIDSIVGFSHRAAGTEMAQALLKKGRQRFGYIGCNLQSDLRAGRRRQGFEDALRQSGLNFEASLTRECLSSVGDGRALTQQILTENPDLDCIYYSNDDVAFGGLCYCLHSGMGVPDRVALSGFNGLGILQGFPGLIATSTTLRRDIGHAAADIIVGSLKAAKRASQTIIMQPQTLLGALDETP
ncbi:LacI family gluconate utilization system Gnt-I transcriptional repressor [Yoonia maritima]|uniref:LacI family gluconate utilization system Gnt-I transcriptional repressor n=1 Tax=Yoonia maritima TaxID=1435347 RepID=A0A2T0VTC1_9RHOB|nr:LacI family DNA-binding transcriptional regulator [Yoonia maritima]PRY74341.1 LacI family gluconate utilization system Gnt-I transcriptional repressor [Yoonia maritima]